MALIARDVSGVKLLSGKAVTLVNGDDVTLSGDLSVVEAKLVKTMKHFIVMHCTLQFLCMYFK